MPQRRGPCKIAFDSYPLALQAAVTGQGIALGWGRTVSSLLKDGKLVRPCRELVARPAEISVLRGSQPGNHRETQALLDWLQAAFSEPL